MTPTSISQSSWTDIVQALASVFAAIGLIFTLRLQRKATDAQVQATESQIEVNKRILEQADRDYQRYLTEIIPSFDVNIENHQFAGECEIRFIAIKNHVYNFTLIQPADEQYALRLAVDRVNIPINSSYIECLFYNPQLNWDNFTIEFRFEDKQQNRYQQFGYLISSGSVTLSIPEKIA